MEEANGWKCRCGASKENKGQFVGMAWSEGILYFVSDLEVVCVFLSTLALAFLPTL